MIAETEIRYTVSTFELWFGHFCLVVSPYKIMKLVYFVGHTDERVWEIQHGRSRCRNDAQENNSRSNSRTWKIDPHVRLSEASWEYFEDRHKTERRLVAHVYYASSQHKLD